MKPEILTIREWNEKTFEMLLKQEFFDINRCVVIIGVNFEDNTVSFNL